MEFENILLFGLVPVVFVFLMILIHHSFIKGSEKKKIRWIVFISRLVILTLLIVALAAPYSSTTRIEKGDSVVNVLIDKSSSMNLFKDDSASLIASLEELDVVNSVVVGEDLKSPIGNALLNSMFGEDNILLISDGNANSGKDLADVIKFASVINSTVNVIKLKEKSKDASVSIIGPKMVLSGLENKFYIKVNNVGNVPYDVVLKRDGQEINRFSDNKARVEEVRLLFSGGYHKLQAELKVSDSNQQNNIFFKAINSLDKPKALYVSQKSSPIEKIFSDMYNLEKVATLPNNLDRYFGVILNDLPANLVNDKTDSLTNYLLDGNGLFVIGGPSSFDLGGYETAQFQTILPTKVGAAVIENITDLNVVLVIDISISSGLATVGGSVVDLEKAQAMSVFNQLDPEDYLGVVAFNNEAHTISELNQVKTQLNTPGKINSLQDTGGTYLETGLLRAGQLLESAAGNKNIIIISDGKTKNPQTALEIAKGLRGEGINIYTVGIGEGTDEGYMDLLAANGGGTYLKAGSEGQLSFVFGTERSNEKKEWSIRSVNSNHFITKDLDINAKIFGFNQVVPKSSAQMLVASSNGLPILSVWRFGLGRVAVLATDAGNSWSGQLLREGNSKLISRTANWVVGDPRRKLGTRVNVGDGRIGESLDISIYSDKVPDINDVQLIEIDTNIYSGNLVPDQTGFFKILGEEFAVNYPREFEDLGLNPELEELVGLTGGQILDVDNHKEIIEKIKKDSEKVIEDREYYRYLILPIAVIVFLVEIFLRRKLKNKEE
ncbi:VWA domain-containing protein [Candidatus Woesearchaeota archaeon]|nr:VWA domain-containing protein [Candidatus Woesearchaeota archaeon]MBT4368192.1 VWA domain-containing protein [Candidatus Woesearchaeota archaeon]MBT4712680.1 VWA domain-containing protein [Candidatus Woesearchaeota archaeon]MBT6639593.1 VWA domain-containing protein [Candidatus Woesearchaeota archaeon]MBT7133765.1 VWA domain-containing protein [Candidatus Woesearchaeota archaeon]